MQESTNEALRQLPVRLLIADYTDSSKAKAMSLAMNATADIPYDAVVIMDADNTAGTSFLSELNPVFQSGARAVQGTPHREKTPIRILPFSMRPVKKSTTQYSAAGTSHSGLSSALIGSGMALEACWFRQHIHLLETAGEDKEMEALLLKQRIHIEYLEHVYVKDEKTQKKEGIKTSANAG